MATVPAFEAQLAGVSGPIRLDLTGLTFLDSCGITALIRLDRQCQSDGCTFQIDGCSPQAEAVLRVVGLYQRLTDTTA
jgi:anti-anti-sigma factor